MKKIIARIVFFWLCVCGDAPCQTSTLYVDFGSSAYTTASPDASGHYWNNCTEATPNGLPNLISDTNELTGISLGVTGTVLVNPFGTTVPNPVTLGGLAVASATMDWFYVYDPNVITVTLGNLAPDGIYRLSLFGSRDSEETRVTKYDVVGQTSVVRMLTSSGLGLGLAPQVNANRSNVALVENLIPAANGSITISVRREVGLFGYLGALRLETMNTVDGPPTATGVAASGAPRVGSGLVGRYTYWDKEGDPESGTQFFWERADSPTGTPTRFVEPSTTALTCVPTLAEQGKYVRLGIIPKSSSGRLQGGAAFSRWMGPVVSAATKTTFHIGSSFTLWPDIPRQLKQLGQTTGDLLMPGVQLTSGRDSRYHWENGLDGGGIGSGLPSRPELATGTWDALVLQPFNSEWMPWSVVQMRTYAQNFYSLADAHGTQVYLYCAWPWRYQSVATQNDINAAFEQVRSAISVGGSRPALIIPAGEALRAVINSSGVGALSGLSRESYYRYQENPLDDLHLNHLGSYVSALTHYATIFKKSPVGLPAQGLDAGFYNDNTVYFDQAVATRIQRLVWWVVANYPNSGVVEQVSYPIDPAGSGYVPPDIGSGNGPGTGTVTLPPRPINYTPAPALVVHDGVVDDPALLSLAFGPALGGGTIPQENLPHLTSGSTPQQIEIEYTINPAAEAAMVTFTPEWSVDLIHWTQTPPPSTLTIRDGQKVRFSWPVTLRREFFRVYLEKPAP